MLHVKYSHIDFGYGSTLNDCGYHHSSYQFEIHVGLLEIKFILMITDVHTRHCSKEPGNIWHELNNQ